MALDAYSFPFAIVFCIIYFLLTVFAAYCIYKFFKKSKFNKLLSRGIKLFLISAILGALSFVAFYQPESGTYAKVKDQGIIAMKDEVVDSASANDTEKNDESTIESNGSSEAGSNGASETESNTDAQETYEVVDMDATMENLSTVAEMISNPLTIAHIITVAISCIFAIIAFIFMVIGGFKKKGKLLFAAASIFCLVLLLYSIGSFLAMDTSMMGLNGRFGIYAVVMFMAFLGSYIYITDVKE